ncbi:MULTISPECIES: CDGSH iron-sulfur domain-containing protein [Legionella]|uniref:CDGSH iron-sulfur domain-containing protein n=1 Tax=Legionella TaxID=445 RepID=UPI001054B7EA|nr:MULTISPECIES: CDGSH iron-sulfur domain-containing protein [Legionella]MCE3043409.1 CDGSH iron-sulfur domain-containing protein [Legionella sp. 16cNR16C]
MDAEDAGPPPYFPIAWDVEEGQTYEWCGCKETKTPPFCDKGDCKERVLYQAPLTDTVYFCHCKETKDPPFCDGSHARLLREFIKKRNSQE